MQLIEYITNNSSFIIECFKNTCVLVILGTILSLLIWVPVGIFIAKKDKWAGPVMEVANVIYCIPSLALFTLMITIPFLGISRKSALTALVLYSMMPLVRSVYNGIIGVDQSVVEAAKGMGMSDVKILFEIELPLATQVIFTGFRVTVVMITGVSTIATYIGERNLGRLISHGLARQNMEMIIVGAIFISIIAIILDTVLGIVEKRINPKRIRMEK